jgi:hypothetical protein
VSAAQAPTGTVHPATNYNRYRRSLVAAPNADYQAPSCAADAREGSAPAVAGHAAALREQLQPCAVSSCLVLRCCVIGVYRFAVHESAVTKAPSRYSSGGGSDPGVQVRPFCRHTLLLAHELLRPAAAGAASNAVHTHLSAVLRACYMG